MPFIKLNSVEETINASVSIVKDEKGKISYTIDGKSATLKEIDSIYKKIDQNILKNNEYKTRLLQKVLSLLTLNGKNLLLEKSSLKDILKEKISKGNNIISLSLTKGELENFIKENINLILKVEQKAKLEVKIASQAQSTGVDPQAFNGTNTHGENIDVLFADAGCPYPSWFSNYKYIVLDGSETTGQHTRMVGDIIRYGVSEANLLCEDMNTYAGGNFGPNHVDIENHSWGVNNAQISKEYKTLDAQMDNHIISSRNTVFIAAGNDNSIVSSPGKSLNAITVGNYIENSPYHINEDPSDGGSRRSSWENPNTKNEKPEIAAPGTSITNPKQNNLIMSGTSFASPHAATIATQLMSKQNWFIHKTMATKAAILANAIDEVEETDDSPNSNDMKAGEGGIRFAKYNQAWEMFDGSCSSFERTTYISQYSNKTRIALTWLNRGDYMIANQSEAYGNIGLDLDMKVYDPNGNYVGGSYSWDNPYEIVEFDPVISGTYTVKVNCYKKRDTGFDRKMGLASVSFY